MADPTLTVAKDDRIAWITLNRPEKMNALNPQMLQEWHRAILDTRDDDEVGVVVITGAGRAFCAGVDLTTVTDREGQGGAVGPDYDQPAHELIQAMLDLPKVIIGMINGACIAGGLELMLAFDLVVASDDARFRDPHTNWGLRPSWGMSQRLPRIVGLMRARELSFTARFFSAREALAMGLINRVVPQDQLRQQTIHMAKQILGNSLESVAAFKSLYNRGMATTLAKGLELEQETDFSITDTSDRLANFGEPS
ncbi:enoyl-CoA hydratase [Desulfosarcina ovata subsp. sediminis]|uniref:Enoyl-CoA hydratase n=1 Tax=Desulfosarcina ovata subsp. sediminis TaxID=885957 RepID=A0A5K7ZVC4_9BACT|nr:enoyl-CoA hydratase/isomerase family protein [Desulfosarcina ovata]BBO84187.1 enoyl-CoA hydratase [Desulfosarcina ovata subsp. sediminis]